MSETSGSSAENSSGFHWDSLQVLQSFLSTDDDKNGVRSAGSAKRKHLRLSNMRRIVSARSVTCHDPFDVESDSADEERSPKHYRSSSAREPEVKQRRLDPNAPPGCRHQHACQIDRPDYLRHQRRQDLRFNQRTYPLFGDHSPPLQSSSSQPSSSYMSPCSAQSSNSSSDSRGERSDNSSRSPGECEAKFSMASICSIATTRSDDAYDDDTSFFTTRSSPDRPEEQWCTFDEADVKDCKLVMEVERRRARIENSCVAKSGHVSHARISASADVGSTIEACDVTDIDVDTSTCELAVLVDLLVGNFERVSVESLQEFSPSQPVDPCCSPDQGGSWLTG